MFRRKKTITFEDIADLFCVYGNNPCAYEDDITGSINFTADLGGRTIVATYLKDSYLMLGMKSGKTFITKYPNKCGRKMLSDFENEIIAWREDHKGIAKKIGEENG